MAEYKKVHQNKNTITIPRDSISLLAENPNLSKKDYRVALFLLCRLDGERYTMIDIEQIAESLYISKKDVKKSLNNLIFEGLLVCGSDDHVSDGYKFLF